MRPLMAGDVVRLRCGGPMMTVGFIDSDYCCVALGAGSPQEHVGAAPTRAKEESHAENSGVTDALATTSCVEGDFDFAES